VNKVWIATGAAIAAMLFGCGIDSTTPDSAPAPENATSSPAKANGKAAPTKAAKPLSAEQRNAARSAQNYLDGELGFSRKSLIGQLKYEGYAVPAATAAVDSLGVDWNAQAALKAQRYLDGQAFSRKSLTAQLKYEGFTTSQALYGVKQAGL
jgi:hypothetical protein